jgi:hypothetical protein
MIGHVCLRADESLELKLRQGGKNRIPRPTQLLNARRSKKTMAGEKGISMVSMSRIRNLCLTGSGVRNSTSMGRQGVLRSRGF